jgi:hypothetical protein
MKVHPIFLLNLVTAALRPNTAAATPSAADPSLDQPDMRSRSALSGDAADGQLFLEWNPGFEDNPD